VILVALALGCGTPGSDSDAVGTSLPENPDIVGGLGSACRNSSDCADPDLVCDARLPGGLCTLACDDLPTEPADESACFDDRLATCLSVQAGGVGWCTPQCDNSAPAGEPGACLDNQVCTGLWWKRLPGPADAHGCLPWCHDDTPCGPERECFGRMGQCAPHGATAGDAGKPDGEPCSVRARNDAGYSTECRGDCFFVFDASDDRGICASFLDFSVAKDCPDRPEVTRALGFFGDDVAICLFRDCESTDDCTPPLVCGSCPDRGSCCVYP
jgi:hypothetical protein